jgi:folylpolyglutamate synthase/dihydropteroate synthase
VATSSSNPRALPAGELAALARVPAEAVDDPFKALARARELAGPGGAVLVTGSLYLLQDLAVQEGVHDA